MKHKLKKLLEKHDLLRIKPVLEKFILPCVSFDLKTEIDSTQNIKSKLGGKPDLPIDFVWSSNRGRPLDFLLQLDLSEVSKFDKSGLLPNEGLLSFFYDLEDQPWGFDPEDLDGYKIVYSPNKDTLKKWNNPNLDVVMKEFELILKTGETVPYVGSLFYEKLSNEAGITDEEFDSYWDFADEFHEELCGFSNPHSMSHRILGNSQNIQGDMQEDAQLVMNGYYCGKPFEDEDLKREKLKETADEWILLLQLDSDDRGEFMWGDNGKLYYWIRKDDLIQCNFDNVWMDLQCH